MGKQDDDGLIRTPKVVAKFEIELHDDGNMTLAFSGPLASAPVAQHMLKKALQGIDDEQFAVFLKAAEEAQTLVKMAGPGALNGVTIGPRKLHG